MKLRTKIFLIFSILATIPLLILTGFTYRRYTATIYDRMDEISSNLFDNARETANSTLESISQTASTFNLYYNNNSSSIRDLTEFSDPDTKPDIWKYHETSQSFRQLCQNMLYMDEFIYGIYILTPSGYIFDCYNGENGTIRTDYDFQNAYWYQDVLDLDGSLYVSREDQHSCFTGIRKSIFFAECLKDVYTHDIVGILLIDCNPEMLDLSAVNTLPDITMITIDNTRTNDVLYTNYDEEIHHFSEKSRNVRQADLGVASLRLTTVVDYESLYNEFNVTGMLMILIAAVCIAGFIFFAYIVSRYMVRPIEHLSHKMSVQTGHTLIQTTRYLNRTDEIGTLYNEYNAMVDSLNAAVKQDYQDKLIILDAQMKSMEARINSHFLFNTLESINSMAELDDDEQIATMSLALGNMFRYTLKTQSELVTVKQELGHVNDYVSIQQIRFDNRFRLAVDMTPEFKEYRVLKLILQPLVENALYHGLKYCTYGDTISISGSEEDGCLYLDVRDNGQGISPEILETLRQSLSEEASFTELGHRNKQSIGLKNIHSRIELYYGKGYGLTITSEPGKWTNIRIRLPKLDEREE